MTSPRRGRPRIIDQRRPGDTPREEILDAAAELFTECGYTATSTRAIADACLRALTATSGTRLKAQAHRILDELAAPQEE